MQERTEHADIVKSEDVAKLLKNLNPVNLFESPECSVCLSQIHTEMYILKCGHYYHKEW
jgi:hypothetical protein